MRARNMVTGASFGPDALKVITQAFDEAWASIAAQYEAGTPVQKDAARFRLAQAVFSVARARLVHLANGSLALYHCVGS